MFPSSTILSDASITLQLKPYVPWMTYLSQEEMDKQPFGRLPQGGLTGQIYLDTIKGRRKTVSTQPAELVVDAKGEVVA